MSCLRDAAPLLELDRDERKLEAFLQLHKHDLLVADLRIFLPFTINLDPYLRKVLKEDQQALEDEGIVIPMRSSLPMSTMSTMPTHRMNAQGHYAMMQGMMNQSNIDSFPIQNQMPLQQPYMQQTANSQPFAMSGFAVNNFPAPNSAPVPEPMQRKKSIIDNINPFMSEHRNVPNDALSSFPVSHPTVSESLSILTCIVCYFQEDLLHVRLSKLTVDGLLGLLRDIEELEPAYDKLANALQLNAISGRVLMHCDLNELKSLIGLSFGHWEIFRLLISCLRDVEKLQPSLKLTEIDSIHPPMQRKKSVIEKQVSRITHCAHSPSRRIPLSANKIPSCPTFMSFATHTLIIHYFISDMQLRSHDYDYMQVMWTVEWPWLEL